MNGFNFSTTVRKAQRQHDLLHILQAEFNGQPANQLDKTSLGKRLGATRQTIGRDLQELHEQQRLSVNGYVEVIR